MKQTSLIFIAMLVLIFVFLYLRGAFDFRKKDHFEDYLAKRVYYNELDNAGLVPCSSNGCDYDQMYPSQQIKAQVPVPVQVPVQVPVPAQVQVQVQVPVPVPVPVKAQAQEQQPADTKTVSKSMPEKEPELLAKPLPSETMPVAKNTDEKCNLNTDLEEENCPQQNMYNECNEGINPYNCLKTQFHITYESQQQ